MQENSGGQRMRKPRLLGQPLGFKSLDLVALAQREADVVKAVEQAILAEGLNIKRNLLALRLHDDLTLQVNREGVAGEGKALVEQLGHLRLRQRDGQQAVLEAVVKEDVGIAGRNDGAKAVLVQRPGRVLARGAAAEVLACQQDRRTCIARLVQHEVRVGFAAVRVLTRKAGVQVAPGIKQVLAEACLSDRFKELLGDDRVGIDVLAVLRSDQAFVYGEFLHVLKPLVGGVFWV